MKKVTFLILSFAGLLFGGDIGSIVGPVIPMGQSPWPWYDKAEAGNVRDITAAALAHKPQVGPAAAGTFALADGCNITLTGAGASEFHAGDWAIVAWNGSDGPGTGRMPFIIGSIAGNVMTSSNQCGLPPNVSPATGLTVYHCGANCNQDTGNPVTYSYPWWGLFSQGDGWNFYDTVLALYRYYLRTGNAADLATFRDYADTWWVWGLNQGGKIINPPRAVSLVGQFVRALDGHPERLAPLYNMIKTNYDANLFTGAQLNPNDPKTGFDNREMGYMTLFVAVGARADADPARHAWYCSTLQSDVNKWILYQRPEGYWMEKSTVFPYRLPSVSPWRMFAVVQALARAYDVLNDTTAAGCNNTALAAATLTAVTKAADFIYNYGRASNRGLYYDVMGPNVGLVASPGTGTVSVSLASPLAVTGSGTSFTTQLGVGKYIGIQHLDGETYTHRVASILDNTHLLLDASQPWGNPGGGAAGPTGDAVNERFVITDPAPTNCNGTAPTCFANLGNATDGTIAGDRNSARDGIWIQGWVYKTTGNPIYKAHGDELFSASYGGPAGGPGYNFPNNPGACGGPACDGIETDYMAAIHGCGSDPT